MNVTSSSVINTFIMKSNNRLSESLSRQKSLTPVKSKPSIQNTINNHHKK
jgi:hypothetical protein